MALRIQEIDEPALKLIGEEAIGMLKIGDFAGLATRFGYALAFDRDPASALKEDLRREIRQEMVSTTPDENQAPQVEVKVFRENASGLKAIIECTTMVDGLGSVLLELAVTLKEDEHYLCIEDIACGRGQA